MTVPTPGPDRCPTCAAAVRPADPWCTLCYADLRPAPQAQPQPQPAPDLGAAPAGPSWPCTACGADNSLERDTCAGCGASFLAGLRSQGGPLLELPVVGDLTRWGRGQRLALAGGVVLVVVVVTVLVGVLLH